MTIKKTKKQTVGELSSKLIQFNRNKENLVDDVLMYNSVVCDKTEDGAYKVNDQLFFSEPW